MPVPLANLPFSGRSFLYEHEYKLVALLTVLCTKIPVLALREPAANSVRVGLQVPAAALWRGRSTPLGSMGVRSVIQESFIRGNQGRDITSDSQIKLHVRRATMEPKLYYREGISPGERFLLKRDPSCQEDTNCIQVLAMPSGSLVGHICREHAKDLAHKMDASGPETKFFAVRGPKPTSNIYRVRVTTSEYAECMLQASAKDN
eukprot:scaffold103069_cov34-Prasinocladus_malaysianus.AAC.1